MDKIIGILINKWYLDCLVYNIPISPSDIKDIVEDLLKTKEEADQWKGELPILGEESNFDIDNFRETLREFETTDEDIVELAVRYIQCAIEKGNLIVRRQTNDLVRIKI